MHHQKSFDHKQLIDFSKTILIKAGLETDRAQIVAETLVAADLMGHSTHGLQLLPLYVNELENAGMMTNAGQPKVVNDKGSAITWDGKYLAGPWLVYKAIDLAFERIKDHPVVSIAIQKSHHIGCLATYLERATDKGLMMMLSCSDPRNKTVAPFGGIRPVYSPNPMAAGIPTESDPIIFDVSMSATSNGLVARTYEDGGKLGHSWLMDGDGNPTNDPAEFYKDPPATILPLGGLDTGYKGFALGILVEALTNALGGYGRSDEPTKWGGSVFLQLIDPNAFAGSESFQKEMQFLADCCMETETRPGESPVRMPGARALKLKRRQMKEGLILYPGIVPKLKDLGTRYGVEVPAEV